jgi:HD-like signal output (HDOD) protein
MSESLDQWIERLSEQTLPAMALTMQRVPQLLDSPNTTNNDYQRIIARDPGFTLAIFRTFASMGRTPREPAGNLAHAIALLGTAPMSEASKKLPVLKQVLGGEARQALYNCYSRACHASWYAYSWGRDRKENNPEEMAIAALMHECGEMALWVHAREKIEKILALETKGLNREAAELSVMGFTIEQLSHGLADVWRLPTLTLDALQPGGAFGSRSLGVKLACALAQLSSRNWQRSGLLDHLELVAEYHDFSIDRAAAYVHTLAANAARDLSGLPIPLSIHQLLNTPPETTETLEKEAQATAPQPEARSIPVAKEATGETPPAKEPPPPQRPAAAAGPASRAAKLIKGATTTKRPNPLQEGMSRTFRELRETVGMERVMFAMLTPDRKHLRVKFVVGTDKNSPLRKFQLALSDRHLFSVLMKKPQGFWLRTENREKYLPLIPEPDRDVLNSEGFFVTSVFVRNRPMGLIYADTSKPSELDSHRFEQFKQLAQRFSLTLGQSSTT